MSARDDLRRIAASLAALAPLPVLDATKIAEDAAALRALADRLDEYLAGRGGPVLAAMRRLDAPLAPPQKEPR